MLNRIIRLFLLFVFVSIFPSQHLRAEEQKEYTIQFDNVAIVEYIKFISKISNKNFIFDQNDLQFNITLISEEPTSLSNIMAALMQVLRIRGLSLIEQGNNIIIHKNETIKAPAHTLNGETFTQDTKALATRVFRLRNVNPETISAVITPMLSPAAVIQSITDTKHLVISDLKANIESVANLIKTLDKPEGAFETRRYRAQNHLLSSLVSLAQQILAPQTTDTPLVLVPQVSTNSIFVVSTPFLVEQAMTLLESLDRPLAREEEEQVISIQPEEEKAPIKEEEEDAEDVISLEQFLEQESEEKEPQEPIPEEERSAKDILKELLDRNANSLIDAVEPTTTTLKQDLPPEHIDNVTFYIHKLEYRKGDQIEASLQKIALSLQNAPAINERLLSAVRSAQWVQTSNAIVFTGDRASILRVKELVRTLDVPLRQVFIEMLILETTVENSLNFGVEWTSRMQRSSNNLAAASGFLTNTTALPTALDTVTPGGTTANANTLARATNFSLGIIGEALRLNDSTFLSLGALISAVKSDGMTDVLMNPKIITEDNNPAEIFVGNNLRFQTQVNTNIENSVTSEQFEFRDVGNRLRITPLLGSSDIITLDIEQEMSAVVDEEETNNNPAGPQTSRNRTTTRVHVPNDHFLVISGQITERKGYTSNRVPCLGSIPYIGKYAFGSNRHPHNKVNLMIFIRPHIIESAEEIRKLSKYQLKEFSRRRNLNNTMKESMDNDKSFRNTAPEKLDEGVKEVPPAPDFLQVTELEEQDDNDDLLL